MLNDPLANVMSLMKQADNNGRKTCTIHPASKVIKKVLELLNETYYLGAYEIQTEARGGVLKINMLGKINKCGVVKPRFSVQINEFEKFEKRYLPAKGMGILLVSTSKGLMTHEQAKQKNIGGRLIAYCY